MSQQPQPPRVYRFMYDDNFTEAAAKDTNEGYSYEKRKVGEFIEFSAYEELQRKLADEKEDADRWNAQACELSEKLVQAERERDDYLSRLGDCHNELNAALERADRYKAALESISKNSCCDTCQEAKLVASQALGGVNTYADSEAQKVNIKGDE